MEEVKKFVENMSKEEQIEYECSIIEACTGRDESGAPKGMVSASLISYDNTEGDTDQAYDVLSSKNFMFPDFSMEVHEEFAQIDLHFPGDTARAESELASLWRYLNEYGELTGKVKKNDNPRIFMCFSIIPDGISVDRPSYLSFTNPIYRALMASSVGGKADTIRLLVLSNSLAICNYPDLSDLQEMSDGFARTQYIRDKEEKEQEEK